jgi:hypothetical protein
MFAPVSTRDPLAVRTAVQAVHLRLFPDADPAFVERAFGWADAAFTGHYADYQAIDARYHDFEHTLQGALCIARLLDGRHRAGALPVISARFFQLGILGILLHDTGYLKRRADTEGTGAKYTATHVQRSVEFAARLLAAEGYPPEDIQAVQHMIQCTGLTTAVGDIPFQTEQEKIMGQSLGTADLLGQMSAEDYVDKLPVLYAEFAEAVKQDRANAGFIARFECAEDLVRRTPVFWSDCARPKLDREFGGVHRFLNQPYPDGPNWYIERIEANMARITGRLEAAAR